VNKAGSLSVCLSLKNFTFAIAIFPFLHSNIPLSPAFRLYLTADSICNSLVCGGELSEARQTANIKVYVAGL
jgi:hypothetical protein